MKIVIRPYDTTVKGDLLSDLKEKESFNITLDKY